MSSAFGSIAPNATLHVPAQSLEAYKATDPWNTFGRIVALTDEEVGIGGVEMAAPNTGVKETYDLKGRSLALPRRGINIVRMSDGSVRKVLTK